MEKKFKFPEPFVVMIIIVLAISLLSYVIPSSSYEYKDVTYTVDDEGNTKTRSVVDADTWALAEENQVVTPMMFFTSFLRGMEEVSDIIFFVFIAIGSFSVVTESQAVTAGVGRLIVKMGNKKIILIPVLGFIFAFLGATAGLDEEFIAFIPILCPLVIAAGYDSLICIACIMGCTAAGWAGALTNPFTIGVAQGIVGLPLFSGLGFHIVVFVTMTTLTVVLIMLYARRIEKNPQSSIMYNEDRQYLAEHNVDFSNLPEFTTQRKIILAVVALTIGVMVWGLLNQGWYFEEMSAAFFVMGFVCTFIYGKDLNWWCTTFVDGAKTVIVGALIVGFARAIIVVMNDAQIIHTILHAAASVISALPRSVAVIGQYIFQCLLNYIIPSGSGQATATMPIMGPLADLTGLTQQVAVQCEIIGDALSNPFTPTSGTIHAALALAGIPYIKWVKHWWKVLMIQYGLGLILVLIANALALGPF